MAMVTVASILVLTNRLIPRQAEKRLLKPGFLVPAAHIRQFSRSLVALGNLSRVKMLGQLRGFQWTHAQTKTLPEALRAFMPARAMVQ
jgi:hypothetical protein